jgi:hypothetical protein
MPDLLPKIDQPKSLTIHTESPQTLLVDDVTEGAMLQLSVDNLDDDAKDVCLIIALQVTENCFHGD